MATKQRIEEIVQEFVDKLNDKGPDIAEGWGGAVQIVVPDLNTGWYIKLAMDGTVESCTEKIDEENANGVMDVSSDTFVDIWEQRVAGLDALAMGKFKIRGSMDALMKFAPVLM